jgi:ABC-type antimicrobial peptide transport system permease subunit
VSALLAAIGVYGVLTHAVAQRRREIGIRMALGARRDDVVRLVMRGTLTTVALGLTAGVAGAAAASRLMQSLLFEVSALEPTAFVAGAVAMVVIAAAAAFVPARRAAGVDPSTALRSES